MLSDKSIYEWEVHYFEELQKRVETLVKDKFTISDILLTGSRTYAVYGVDVPLFRYDSDLDIIVVVEEDIIKHKIEFTFYDILCSIFIVSKHRFFEDTVYYRQWVLPKYSLYKRKIYDIRYLHLLDYIFNSRAKVANMKFCWMCRKNSDNTFTVSVQVLKNKPSQNLTGFIPDLRITLCYNCLKKWSKTVDSMFGTKNDLK